jgi:nucleoside-diphosphate-sugar epimerase
MTLFGPEKSHIGSEPFWVKQKFYPLILDTAKAFGFRPPINRATVDKYTEDIAVSGEKICKLLGFKPEYDLVSGWKETIQEMRRNGDL